MSGQQLDIKVKMQTLDDTRTFPLKALLDSGSTGSCIGRKFVNDNEIRTRKTAIPVPVHNADGTLNKNGSITDYIFLRLSIGDHTEQLEFELLAIMTALSEWRHYLLTSKEFEIWTDHQNLCYF